MTESDRMKSSHRYLMAAAVVAVILISVLAAPTVARATLAGAQATATGGGTTALTLQDDTNVTTTPTSPADGTDDTPGVTPTATTLPVDTSPERRFEPFNGTPAGVPGRIEAEDYDTGGQGWAWFDTDPRQPGRRVPPG